MTLIVFTIEAIIHPTNYPLRKRVPSCTGQSSMEQCASWQITVAEIAATERTFFAMDVDFRPVVVVPAAGTRQVTVHTL